MSFERLLYASAAVRPYDRERLQALLHTARQNNAKRGITGMLVYHEGSFLQWLEGPEGGCTALYAKLRQDPNHQKLILLLHDHVDMRQFAEWSMGFANVTVEDIAANPGLNDFFAHGPSHHLTSDEAKRLLSAFRHGYYRVAEGHASFL